MSESIQEELLAALYSIAAIMSFGFGFTVAGWAFAFKAALDTGNAIRLALKEIMRSKDRE